MNARVTHCSACGKAMPRTPRNFFWNCDIGHNPYVTINLCPHCEDEFFSFDRITPEMKVNIFDCLYDQGAFDSVGIGFLRKAEKGVQK